MYRYMNRYMRTWLRSTVHQASELVAVASFALACIALPCMLPKTFIDRSTGNFFTCPPYL